MVNPVVQRTKPFTRETAHRVYVGSRKKPRMKVVTMTTASGRYVDRQIGSAHRVVP